MSHGGKRGVPRRQQGGYVLVATMLAIAILTGAMVLVYRAQARSLEISQSASNGTQMAQFALGLRGFIAAAQADASIIPAAPKTGVTWLKPPSCGGLATNPVAGYVPCTYTGGAYGAQFSTSFTHVVATNAIEARTTFVVPALGGSRTAAILRADRIVQSAQADQAASSGTYFSAWANVPATATGPVSPTLLNPVDAGRVVMVASNAPSNDIYLRTDGTNQMLANLNMGGMSIGNARDGRFTGDVRVEGRAQVDTGLIVQGPSDLRGGLVTSEIALTSVGHYASEGIYQAQVLTGATSYNVAKPNCASAGNNPGIYVAMQGTGTLNQSGYTADAIYSARADVTDAGSMWVVQPKMQGTKFDMTLSGTTLSFTRAVVDAPAPSDMRILVMTRCR